MPSDVLFWCTACLLMPSLDASWASGIVPSRESVFSVHAPVGPRGNAQPAKNIFGRCYIERI